MKDIDLVIKISEKDYKNLQKKDKFNDMALNYYEKLIVHGIPLPEGHGRLIDADALEKLCCENEIGNSSFDSKPIIEQGLCDNGYIIWKPLFNFAPTIIEADKTDKQDHRDKSDYEADDYYRGAQEER